MPLDVDGISLAGQTALVTGGGRGIGRAIAIAVARAGASVAITARSADQLAETVQAIASAGGRALYQPVDVTDQSAVEALVEEVNEQLGPIDLLVNCAGIIGDYGPAWEADPALWWRVIKVNVLGTFLCVRAMVPGMIARRRGRIVNLTSNVAVAHFPHGSAYAVSKAAVTRFTENLSGEVAPYGISVFNLAPGTVRTAMTQHVLDSPAGQKWQPQLRRVFDEGRDVPPEAAARLVVYLASGQADALTGRYLRVGDDVPDLVRRAAEIKEQDRRAMRLRE
jgi:NAD(P)-dependent dehydrogenase (short-subunit alcohol dehydrogenase family)